MAIDIDIGSEHHVLYALGSNGSGQLGTGNYEDIDHPVPVQFDQPPSQTGLPDNVRQLVAGGNHTVALWGNGYAYSCGEGWDGRLGRELRPTIGGGRRQTRLRVVKSDQPTVKPGFSDYMAATWSTTVFTEADGTRVISHGTGDNGELGYGLGVRSRQAEECMNNFPPEGSRIVQLASCMAHVVAVLDNGDVYGWGKGRKGQLGEPAEDVWSPRKTEGIPFAVKKAVCGKDFTCVFGASSTGEILVLGPNKNDRFGVKARAPPDARGWFDVAASWGSIYILYETGQIVSWGRNDHGQLAPPDLPPIAKIAAGSEHCLASTRDGRVVAWGWGEHGNCGGEIDEAGDVKGRFNELDVRGNAVDVFAGCATSFIGTYQQDQAIPASEKSND